MVVVVVVEEVLAAVVVVPLPLLEAAQGVEAALAEEAAVLRGPEAAQMAHKSPQEWVFGP